MPAVKEFRAVEHSIKFFDKVEYFKSGFYLRNLEKEMEMYKQAKKEIDEKIKFIEKQKRDCIKYRLTH